MLAPPAGLINLPVAMDPTQTSATTSFMMLAWKLEPKCRHARFGGVRWGPEMADGVKHLSWTTGNVWTPPSVVTSLEPTTRMVALIMSGYMSEQTLQCRPIQIILARINGHLVPQKKKERILCSGVIRANRLTNTLYCVKSPVDDIYTED